MTAHTPHTPLRRQVLSPPQTRLGWWSVGLAGTSLVLIAFSFIKGFRIDLAQARGEG